MYLPLYIAKRYLIAKKSRNAINIITLISVIGVSVGTMALIVVLSVFNGFDSLIQSLFNSFDPDLKITLTEGKSFNPDTGLIKEVLQHPGILKYAEVVEENALIRNKEKQYIGIIKGVSHNYAQVSGVDSMIYEGEFVLEKNNRPYAIIGQGVAYYLSYRLNFTNPLSIYVPKRTARITANPANAFNRKFIYPAGIFRIEQNYDSKYVILPIEFARELLDYEHEVTSLELDIKDNADISRVQQKLIDLAGPRYAIKNRYEQNATFYKIMETEKWAIFFILTFILIVASFNVIGSLTMLIIEKKKDIAILQGFGASHQLIKKIFLIEGWLISLVGAVAGLILGLIICWLQSEFGIIKLKGSGSFVIEAYPVVVQWIDVISILLTVSGIGFLAAWYPVRYISRKFEFAA